jgi:sialic acid synthase SpsE
MTHKIHLIAEAGNNHNARPAIAKQLVDVAQKAGADSVKFQVIYPEGLYLPKLYADGKLVANEVFQKRLAGMLKDNDYRDLAAYCKSKGIPFSASIFDLRGIDLLDELDVPYFKIASCDLNNSRFLIQAAERGRQMVISTGMATLGEVERAVKDIFSTGNTNLVLMHCVSVYPCRLENMNLSFIDTLKTAFGLPVGLSDHTESSLAAAIAVAKGVTWIEKHFTLDRSSPGFDHAYSMEPDAMVAYIADARASELACQPSGQKVGTTESQTKLRARRSLYAARDLQAGETLDAKDILVVRPEGPLAPNDISLVEGRVLRRNVLQYEPLALEMF